MEFLKLSRRHWSALLGTRRRREDFIKVEGQLRDPKLVGCSPLGTFFSSVPCRSRRGAKKKLLYTYLVLLSLSATCGGATPRREGLGYKLFVIPTPLFPAHACHSCTCMPYMCASDRCFGQKEDHPTSQSAPIPRVIDFVPRRASTASSSLGLVTAWWSSIRSSTLAGQGDRS